MSSNTTFLAFDYGLKNIGVAFGQQITSTASELAPLKARDGIPNWPEVEKLIKQWQPDRLLVGLPFNMDDSETELCPRVRKFAQRLHGRYGLPVDLYDERLTTRLAKEEAAERGHHGHYASAPIDSIAARILLEGYLQELASKNA